MGKKFLSILLATAVFSGVFAATNVSHAESKEMAAYKKELVALGKEEGGGMDYLDIVYNLKDLDKDGVKEMIVCLQIGGANVTAHSYVYDYSNGSINRFGPISEIQSGKGAYFYCSNATPVGGCYRMIYKYIGNGEAIQIAEETTCMWDENGKPIEGFWTIMGKEVSQKKAARMVDKFEKKMKPINRNKKYTYYGKK